MSTGEMKIRKELETEVERDLEEEIKAGICNLVLKLHNLYHHQNQRYFNPHKQNKLGNATKMPISEVSINIKIEGGTIVQVKEFKKEVEAKTCSTNPVKYVHTKVTPTRGVKFDWATSLRTGSRISNITRKN